jgi:hypothetical protein
MLNTNQPRYYMCFYPPVSFYDSSILGRFAFPRFSLLTNLIPREELCKSIPAAYSASKKQDAVLNNVMGENIFNNLMVTTTPVMRGTGDQINEEVLNQI